MMNGAVRRCTLQFIELVRQLVNQQFCLLLEVTAWPRGVGISRQAKSDRKPPPLLW
jgi:hypothetical protein